MDVSLMVWRGGVKNPSLVLWCFLGLKHGRQKMGLLSRWRRDENRENTVATFAPACVALVGELEGKRLDTPFLRLLTPPWRQDAKNMQILCFWRAQPHEFEAVRSGRL